MSPLSLEFHSCYGLLIWKVGFWGIYGFTVAWDSTICFDQNLVYLLFF